MNRFEQPPHDPTSTIDTREGERVHRFEHVIIRHANRTPEGQLTAEGLEMIMAKGKELNDAAEVVKGWAAREKSNRAFLTADGIAHESGAVSALTEKQYATRRREGLHYAVVGPLQDRIDAQTDSINAAVKRDHPEYDPRDSRWAKTREGYQFIGLLNLVQDKEVMHALAMGLAHNVQRTEQIGVEYIQRRNSAVERKEENARPIQNDIVLMEATHGVFPEALLQKAMIRKTATGEQRGFSVVADEHGQVQLEQAMGGMIAPTESIRFGHGIDESTPDRMPLQFEKERFPGEQVFLDMPTVAQLAEQYETYQHMLKRWQNGELSKEDFIVELQALVKEYEEWERTAQTSLPSF